jgi:hypothetical protein
VADSSDWRSIITRTRRRDFKTNVNGIVWDKRAFCPTSLFEVDDVVVSENLKIK